MPEDAVRVVKKDGKHGKKSAKDEAPASPGLRSAGTVGRKSKPRRNSAKPSKEHGKIDARRTPSADDPQENDSAAAPHSPRRCLSDTDLKASTVCAS